MLAPSSNGSNGRGLGGRFAPGNPGGPGNPHARKAAALRKAFQDCVGEEDIRAIVAELIARAKAGEPWAVRELLDRSLGKPTPAEMSDEADEPVSNSALHAAPIMADFADFLEILPPNLVPQAMKDWLSFYRLAHEPSHSVAPKLRMEALARQGLECLRRERAPDFELPPGTVEEQAHFLFSTLPAAQPARWG